MANIIVYLSIVDQFHGLFENLRVGLRTGVAPNTYIHVSPYIQLPGAIGILCAVAFLVWQHRAATTAADLGFPARRSPGLGVGSWFIPIVNLWFPYQALVDCLPPDDRARGRALPAWLAYLFATPLASVSAGVGFFAGFGAAAVVVAVVSVVLMVVAVGLGWQLVGRIDSVQRAELVRRGW